MQKKMHFGLVVYIKVFPEYILASCHTVYAVLVVATGRRETFSHALFSPSARLNVVRKACTRRLGLQIKVLGVNLVLRCSVLTIK
jgi:hypothetical protein